MRVVALYATLAATVPDGPVSLKLVVVRRGRIDRPRERRGDRCRPRDAGRTAGRRLRRHGRRRRVAVGHDRGVDEVVGRVVARRRERACTRPVDPVGAVRHGRERPGRDRRCEPRSRDREERVRVDGQDVDRAGLQDGRACERLLLPAGRRLAGERHLREQHAGRRPEAADVGPGLAGGLVEADRVEIGRTSTVTLTTELVAPRACAGAPVLRRQTGDGRHEERREELARAGGGREGPRDGSREARFRRRP